MLAVQSVIKKVAARHSTRGKKADDNGKHDIIDVDTPLRNNPPMPTDEQENEVIVPKKVVKNKNGDAILAVEMQQLVIYLQGISSLLQGMVSEVMCQVPSILLL